MKLTRVTPAGLEIFGEVPTAFEFLVSEPPSQKTQMATLNYILRYLVAIYRNFNANNNFLFLLLSKGVKALAKCWNFKCEFQTKYSSYQHETNASNSGRT